MYNVINGKKSWQEVFIYFFYVHKYEQIVKTTFFPIIRIFFFFYLFTDSTVPLWKMPVV